MSAATNRQTGPALAAASAADRDHSSARLSTTPSAWIVVVTKGMQERAVRERLIHQGFDVYLPMRMVHGPKKGAYPAPFFPRHLFARLTLEAERWQSIFTTVGVSRVLSSPERPLGVRDEFIHRIRDREKDGYLSLGVVRNANAPKEKPAYKPGEKVSTLGGVVDLLFDTWIDEKRSLLLASVASDSSWKVTVDLRNRAGR